MSEPDTSRHARPTPESDQPPAPEPTYAERARTLVALGRIGSLSTASRKQPGWPFGSVMPYSADEAGRPIFLISSMAMHTQNIAADARSSLLVTQMEAGADPLGASRVTLLGKTVRLPEEDLASARETYLSHYTNARSWVDYGDFAFYRLEIVDVYLVAGFGAMGWVSPAEYLAAEPDPLAEAAPGIISHMNADHVDALVSIANAFGNAGADEAQMTAVDRLGFQLRLKAGGRIRGLRLGFPREVRSSEEARAVFIEMVRSARSR